MGMPVVVDVRDGDVGSAALDRAFKWLRFVDATFSTYRADSEICRLDRGELALRDAHPVVREVLARCERLRVATGGYFDARARGPLDPSGLVKGWSVERAAGLLSAAGARRFCVNAGGDVLVRGGPWRVGVQHPHRRDRLAAVLSLTDGAVATSGTYERGEHILDPHTRQPPSGALAVTVLGRDLATADAFATAAFAMGERGPAWTARLRGCGAMTILAGDRVVSTRRFLRHRVPLSPAR
jgi:FAD:protein FMN transferase